MGSGLCRRTGGNPRVDTIDGRRLCRKIVFDYAKQWTRCSNDHPKSGERNYTIRHNKREKTKPVISGPFPADPDRLEGDKWRYVILTRLDTEPPPERPPRTRRRRRSCGRVSGRRRPSRRDTVAAAAGRDKRVSASELTDTTSRARHRFRRPAELMDMVSRACHRFRRPTKRSWLWSAAAVMDVVPETIIRSTRTTRRNGFFESVERCTAMANGLLS